MKMNLLFLLLLTSTANAATWYVSPTGNDGNTERWRSRFSRSRKAMTLLWQGTPSTCAAGLTSPPQKLLLPVMV